MPLARHQQHRADGLLAFCKAMDPNDTPIELAFQEKYGGILRHAWYGDGYIIIGFQSGQVVVVSTHNREMSEEVYSGCYLTSNLVDIAVCSANNRAAIAGTRTVKVMELGSGFKELPGETITLPSGPSIDAVAWTDDGQVSFPPTAHLQKLLFPGISVRLPLWP